MEVSASATFNVASTLAVCSRSACRAVTWPSAISFHVVQIGGAQNFASLVWSAVRAVLVSWPRAWTSLIAWAHAVLVRAGGGPGRNWSPRLRTNGVTLPQLVKTGAGKLGGVSW